MKAKKNGHPRQIKPVTNFTPPTLDGGDEFMANGIFEFNITKLLGFIKANSERFPVELVNLEDWVIHLPELDEKTVESANVSNPIVLAEISPDRFNAIDGRHRIERARRDGVKKVPAYRVRAEQHVAFLTSARAYEAYISYWNEKLDDLLP